MFLNAGYRYLGIRVVYKGNKIHYGGNCWYYICSHVIDLGLIGNFQKSHNLLSPCNNSIFAIDKPTRVLIL